MKNLILIIILFVFIQKVEAQQAIIPEPVDYQSNGETFILNEQLNFNIQTKNEQSLKYVQQFKTFIESCGIETIESKTKKGQSLIVKLYAEQVEELGEEGYELIVSSNAITLTANKAVGLFNGFQTLKQLLPIKSDLSQNINPESINIIGCRIKDYPRFVWRGLMLDVSRHFFSVDDVKLYIDRMSQYKFNVFHWHLTDDNGWRIEIKSFPKLTEVGAWRVERYGRFGSSRLEPQEGEETTYGGFYTQEDIKEVVQYAADRNITIVPEIDVPGHSMALLAAYPEFSSYGESKYVSPGNKFAEWGDGTFEMLVENMLNPADEKVYDFLDKVFTELADLFPGDYIHMGGDECDHGYWEKNPAVKEFMKKNNISNGEELQSHFVKRVSKIITSKGKKMIGWDEILIGGIADDAAVMSWRGMEGGIKAANMGHKVVMTPTTYAYLDYSQGDHSIENKIYSSLSLEKSYSFEPVPDSVDAKNIMGGQGNLWTEHIPNVQFAFYMAYPRAFALSETFWSPKEKKNWEHFIQKAELHFQRFDSENTNICKAVYEPQMKIYKEEGKMMCELTNAIPGSDILYTINNTYPVKFGTKYTEPFEIPVGELSLRTRTFRNNLPLGRELLVPRSVLQKRVVKK